MGSVVYVRIVWVLELVLVLPLLVSVAADFCRSVMLLGVDRSSLSLRKWGTNLNTHHVHKKVAERPIVTCFYRSKK